jgi:hypothetical protein
MTRSAGCRLARPLQPFTAMETHPLDPPRSRRPSLSRAARATRGAAVGLALATAILSCSSDATTGPRTVESRGPALRGITWDPIWAAINDIEQWCPAVAAILYDMLSNGQIYFDDVMANRGDIAWGTYGGDIELDEEYYWGQGDPEAILAQLIPDLMHEAGHAVGGYDDDGTCCPHHNPYDDGCPEMLPQVRAKKLWVAPSPRRTLELPMSQLMNTRRGLSAQLSSKAHHHPGGIAR